MREALFDMYDFLTSVKQFKFDGFSKLDLEIPPKPIRGSPVYIVPVLRPKAVEGESRASGYEVKTRYMYIFVRRVGSQGYGQNDFWEICQMYSVIKREHAKDVVADK
jgi:hypothetical protein